MLRIQFIYYVPAFLSNASQLIQLIKSFFINKKFIFENFIFLKFCLILFCLIKKFYIIIIIIIIILFPSIAFLATSTCSSLNTASIQLNNFMSSTLKFIKILFHYPITQIKIIQFYFSYFLCSSLLTVNS